MNGFFNLFEDKRKRKIEQAIAIKEAVANGNFTVVNLPPKNRKEHKAMQEAVENGDYAEVNLGLSEAELNELAAAIPDAQIIEISDTNVCSACGASISAKAKFCSECGSPLVRKCTSCGKELKPGMKFCPECGAKV